MEASDKDTIGTLNELIETSKDGEYGFRQCAEHAHAEELRTQFSQRADDCQRGARELQQQIAQLGGEPDTGGSAGGALHRGWVSVREKLSGSTDLALLEESERGEDAALKRYRDALAKPLPAAVKTIVERQYQGVKRSHDQIRDLRNRLRAVA